LTTKDYYPASSCVPFLAYAFVFNGAVYIASLGSGIAKKSAPIAKAIFIEAIATLFLNFALVPWLGKEGAAVAAAVSTLLGAIYLFYASQKNYYIPYRFGPVLICLGFSCLLIGIDRFFLPGNGVFALTARGMMCALFIPVAFIVGIVHPYHVKRLVCMGKA